MTFAVIEWMARNLPFYSWLLAAVLGLAAGGLCFLVGSRLFGGRLLSRDAEGEVVVQVPSSTWDTREPLEPSSPTGRRQAVAVTAALYSEARGVEVSEVSGELAARGLSEIDANLLAHLVPVAFCIEFLDRQGVPLPDDISWADSHDQDLPGSLDDQPFFLAARELAGDVPRDAQAAGELGGVACHCPLWQEIERQLGEGRIPKEIEVPRIVVRLPSKGRGMSDEAQRGPPDSVRGGP